MHILFRSLSFHFPQYLLTSIVLDPIAYPLVSPGPHIPQTPPHSVKAGQLIYLFIRSFCCVPHHLLLQSLFCFLSDVIKFSFQGISMAAEVSHFPQVSLPLSEGEDWTQNLKNLTLAPLVFLFFFFTSLPNQFPSCLFTF